MYQYLTLTTESDQFKIVSLINFDENNVLTFEMPCFEIWDKNGKLVEIWDNEKYLINKFYPYLIGNYNDLTDQEVNDFNITFFVDKSEIAEIFIEAFRIGIFNHDE